MHAFIAIRRDSYAWDVVHLMIDLDVPIIAQHVDYPYLVVVELAQASILCIPQPRGEVFLPLPLHSDTPMPYSFPSLFSLKARGTRRQGRGRAKGGGSPGSRGINSLLGPSGHRWRIGPMVRARVQLLGRQSKLPARR